ncbi:MAG: ArnT family glycosyltransferase [Anaerolineae bacterium]
MLSPSISITSAEPAPSLHRRKAQAAGWWLTFALVVVLGAALRLYALDLTDLRYDEASAMRFGWRVARGEWFVALPNTGSVANHPPVYAYLMAIPYLFTRDFMAAATYRVLIEAVGLIICGWLCARYFNRRTAIWAGLCFAVAPWAVLFARKLYVQPLPIFSTVLLFGLLEITRRRSPWGWAIAGWGLALAAGCHLSALYLAPVVLVTAIRFHQTLRPLPVLTGLLPGLLLASAYLWQDAAAGFVNVHSLLGAASQGAQTGLDALWRALWLSAGLHVSDLTGPAYSAWRASTPAILDAPGWMQAGLMLASAAWLIVRSARRLPRPQSSLPTGANDGASELVLLLFVLFPVALQLRHSQPIQMHYLLPIYPAPFIILGCGIDGALSWAAQRQRPAAWLLRAGLPLAMTIILAGHVWTYARLIDFIAEHDTSNGGYGPPARHALALAQMAQENLHTEEGFAGPREVIVVTSGADPNTNEQAAVWEVLLADVSHRFADSNAGLILPCWPAIYVFTPGSEPARQRLHQWLANSSAQVEFVTVAVRAGSALTMAMARVDEACRPYHSSPSLVAHARWEHGATLLDYHVRWAEDGQKIDLDTFLGVEAAPPAGADFHWFNHLLAGEEKVAQADGSGIHPANWRVGDVLWQWFEISLPPEIAANRAALADQRLRLRIGSYAYPSVQNVPLTDAEGYITDGFEIPIKISTGTLR